MTRRRSTSSIILTICSLMMAAAVSSTEVFALAQQDPLEIVRTRNQTVERIVGQSGDEVSDETREELKEVINGFIDFEELSKRALGKHWSDRTEQERADFISVFSQLIKNSSVKKLEIYQADRLVYQKPEINGAAAEVTTVAYKDRKQVEIIYKMHKVGDEWRVWDMEIDGASTARNYRDSFYKQIAKSSYSEMYDKLLKRLERDSQFDQ